MMPVSGMKDNQSGWRQRNRFHEFAGARVTVSLEDAPHIAEARGMRFPRILKCII
jgi:hypothetical protein